MINYKGLKLHEFLSGGKPVKCSPVELEMFLNKNNIKLPDSYVDFLVSVNGGRINHKQFAQLPTDRKRNESHYLRTLNPFAPGNDWEGLEGIWTLFKRFYPERFFPIGIDSEDCQLFIMTSGEHCGKIFLIDAQVTRVTPKSTDKAVLKDEGIFFVADTFDELIETIEITNLQS